MRHTAYIGIGSNIGDKVGSCERAISEIIKIDRHRLLAKSSFFKTQPIGYKDQDWFINGVIKIETDLSPHELLQHLKSIELALGRKETFRWGPRLIDLDLLFFDQEEIQTTDLCVPHPRLHKRRFVLIPMAEIDRDFIHPVFKVTIQQLLDNLQEDQGVEKFKPFPSDQK